MTMLTLYHGTDIESALDILNNGLDKDTLLDRQTRSVQSGSGWYTAIEPNVAWFFATLAIDALEQCTVIQCLIPEEKFDYLVAKKLARRETIVNVPFESEQVYFSLSAFDYLNEHATFMPYREAE